MQLYLRWPLMVQYNLGKVGFPGFNEFPKWNHFADLVMFVESTVNQDTLIQSLWAAFSSFYTHFQQHSKSRLWLDHTRTWTLLFQSHASNDFTENFWPLARHTIAWGRYQGPMLAMNLVLQSQRWLVPLCYRL